MVTAFGVNALLLTTTSTVGGGGGVPVAVKATGEPAKPVAAPSAPWPPSVAPRVQTVVAPVVSVVEVVGATEPPPLVACQVITTPATPLPNWSAARTLRGAGSAMLTSPVCASPLLRASVVAAPGRAVAEKLTGDPLAPETVAVAVRVPAACGSVQVDAAKPEASVTPLVGAITAPVPAALHVTVAPTSGCPSRVTRTRIGLASAWPTVPLWLFPLTGARATTRGGGGGGPPPPSPPEQATNMNQQGPEEQTPPDRPRVEGWTHHDLHLLIEGRPRCAAIRSRFV